MHDLPRKLVQEAIVASPFGRALGLELLELEPGRVRVCMPFARERTTLGDLVHGGAIAGLVDVAATAAVWSQVDDPVRARGTTIGFTISFLAGSQATALVAEAEVLRRGREVSFVEVTVRGEDGDARARASVTYKLSRREGAGRASVS